MSEDEFKEHQASQIEEKSGENMDADIDSVVTEGIALAEKPVKCEAHAGQRSIQRVRIQWIGE